jgi:hypothetical protein
VAERPVARECVAPSEKNKSCFRGWAEDAIQHSSNHDGDANGNQIANVRENCTEARKLDRISLRNRV